MEIFLESTTENDQKGLVKALGRKFEDETDYTSDKDESKRPL